MPTLPTAEPFDFVVLGSGPAGEKAAAQAAYFGKRVAIVERAPEVGGASTHTGTLPSKTLRETALYLTGFRHRELYGMKLRLDRKKSLRQLVGRLKQVIDLQTRQIRRNLERHGIALVQGSASFEDPNTLAVRDSAGELTRRLTAAAFLISTGSSPMPPRGIEIRDPDVVDSDRILDLDRVPTSMTVVGGGVIGTEYACLFAALGTRITLVEGRERLLGGIDVEFSAAIQLSLERMGAEIILGDAVVSLVRIPGKPDNALALKLSSGRRLRADKVLFSAGRAGNTRGLNLETIGVAVTDRGHIRVNEHFQTTVPHIYAAGDVIGFPGLASASMEQGRVAACHAFEIAYKQAMSPLLPFGIYSIPEISTVGASELELKEKGTPFAVGRARFENNARGQITGDSDGMIKLLFDPASRKLLGAHILGEHATELIHIPMFVMASGGGIDAFIDAVFNFPTLAESFKYAAYDGLQRLAATRDQAPPPEGRTAGNPATRHWFLGMGASAPPVPGSPIAICEMDRWRRCRFSTWTFDPAGAGLLPSEADRDGFALGASGDGAPALLDCLRPRYGMAGEVPPESAEIVRVRPEDVWKVFGPADRTARRTPAGERRVGYEVLTSLGLELPVGEAAVHQDQLDAAASAFIAYLWATGRATVEDGTAVPLPNP
jgi:NAD(P) transhydrogenase